MVDAFIAYYLSSSVLVISWHFLVLLGEAPWPCYLSLNSSIYAQLLRMHCCCCVLNSVAISIFQFVDLMGLPISYKFTNGDADAIMYCLMRHTLEYIWTCLCSSLTTFCRCHPLPVAKLMHFPWVWESILNCYFCFPTVMCCQIWIFDV